MDKISYAIPYMVPTYISYTFTNIACMLNIMSVGYIEPQKGKKASDSNIHSSRT